MSTLDYVFHPRSVAVAGASNERENVGRMFLKALLDFHFKGPIYVVNPKGTEVLGHKVYPSLKDVPGPVDYVTATIPARAVIDFMRNCVSKQVKAVHFFTSGFKEMGTQGAQLEAELVEIAKQGGVRIIGPNCMGLYCPESGLSYAPNFPRESGDIAFISQSGGNAGQFIQMSARFGLHCSKVISYGNASDLNETDFLEYCAEDPVTKIIGMYIEGVKDGQQFFRVLKEAAQRKPVIILKGGRTHAGTRAIASHTGSLMGNGVVWDSIFKQTQAIRVDNLEELVDTVLAIRCFPNLKGRRTGVIGFGGGLSVQAADQLEMTGLSVPSLPEDAQQQLRKFTFFSSDAGSIFNNPIDSPLVFADPKKLLQMINIVGACSEIDLLIGFLGIDMSLYARDMKSELLAMSNTLIEYGASRLKPMVVASTPTITEDHNDIVSEIRKNALRHGLPFYPSLVRAARAIYKATEYQQKRAGL